MYTHQLHAFSQPVVVINPGEYLVSEEDVIISTVLGSCIAVVLYDITLGIGGMNHFMLPGAFHHHPMHGGTINPQDFLEESARYGMYAMEVLINEMMKRGVHRRKIQAKVFGGASVIHRSDEGRKNIADTNIDFVFEYLETEKIPLVSFDVGGSLARKIFFFVKTGKVLLKRIRGPSLAIIQDQELSYRKTLSSRPPEGPILFFTDSEKADDSSAGAVEWGKKEK
ncbi:MAG: chemotaxis protein CheD [Treponemataceae bacterium]|nr:chemotaxis protein CheD [Treponemataceae bacterium]